MRIHSCDTYSTGAWSACPPSPAPFQLEHASQCLPQQEYATSPRPSLVDSRHRNFGEIVNHPPPPPRRPCSPRSSLHSHHLCTAQKVTMEVWRRGILVRCSLCRMGVVTFLACMASGVSVLSSNIIYVSSCVSEISSRCSYFSSFEPPPS
jgi:hypothetical protein